jgi:hypothetical protein
VRTLHYLHHPVQQKLLYDVGVADLMIRKSVPLTPSEVDLLRQARMAGTPLHDALVRLAQGEFGTSEASTLRAILTLGIDALMEEISMQDYSHLAAARDAEDEAYEAAMRRRSRSRS